MSPASRRSARMTTYFRNPLTVFIYLQALRTFLSPAKAPSCYSIPFRAPHYLIDLILDYQIAGTYPRAPDKPDRPRPLEFQPRLVFAWSLPVLTWPFDGQVVENLPWRGVCAFIFLYAIIGSNSGLNVGSMNVKLSTSAEKVKREGLGCLGHSKAI